MIVKVIVVDDHPVVRKGLIGLLNLDPQIEIIGEARNGLEGVEMARTLEPDVVVTNYSMPVMDGIEATKIIKREMPHVRVIMHTLSSEQDMATKALLAGADACFTKGANPDNLQNAVKGIV